MYSALRRTGTFAAFAALVCPPSFSGLLPSTPGNPESCFRQESFVASWILELGIDRWPESCFPLFLDNSSRGGLRDLDDVAQWAGENSCGSLEGPITTFGLSQTVTGIAESRWL